MKNERRHSSLQRAIAVLVLFAFSSVAAFAVATPVTTQILIQNNAQVTAGQLAVAFVACDNTNGNTFVSTGREVLLVQNTDASPHTFTATPVADPYGGTNATFTNYSLAASGSAGAFSAIQMKFQIGWVTGSTISLTCSSNLIKYAVVQYN